MAAVPHDMGQLITIVGRHRHLKLLQISKAELLELARGPVVAPFRDATIRSEFTIQKGFEGIGRDLYAFERAASDLRAGIYGELPIVVLDGLKLSVSDFEDACNCHEAATNFGGDCG